MKLALPAKVLLFLCGAVCVLFALAMNIESQVYVFDRIANFWWLFALLVLVTVTFLGFAVLRGVNAFSALHDPPPEGSSLGAIGEFVLIGIVEATISVAVLVVVLLTLAG